MRTEVARSCALALIPSIITLGLVQACGGSSDAVAQATPTPASDPLEGVWEAVATRRDCATNAVIGTFRGAQTIYRGGTMSSTTSLPPTSAGLGMGVWSRNADGTYAIKFRHFNFAPDGSWSGTTVATSKRTLSADGNSYTTETSADVRDTSGAVIGKICVTDAGTRFN